MAPNEDARILSRDTERIFKEIDEIRRRQIELASEHVSLKETIDDLSVTTDDTEDEYKRDLVSFNKKEVALKSLMNKLDTLGQIMNDFREATDLNPHTMSNKRVNDDAHIATSTTAFVSPTTATSTSTFNQ